MTNITRKFCPNCGSEDVDMVIGGITGIWVCKSCGYRGTILEKEIIGRDGDIEEKEIRK